MKLQDMRRYMKRPHARTLTIFMATEWQFLKPLIILHPVHFYLCVFSSFRLRFLNDQINCIVLYPFSKCHYVLLYLQTLEGNNMLL